MPTFIWLSVSVSTGGGGDFRAGAGGGRHADQRQDRAGDLVVADVVARRAAVGAGRRRRSWPGPCCCRRRGRARTSGRNSARGRGTRRQQRRLRFAAGEQPRRQAPPRSAARGPVRHSAGLEQHGVGDDEDALEAEQRPATSPSWRTASRPKISCGGVKRPGGAHGGPRRLATPVLSRRTARGSTVRGQSAKERSFIQKSSDVIHSLHGTRFVACNEYSLHDPVPHSCNESALPDFGTPFAGLLGTPFLAHGPRGCV